MRFDRTCAFREKGLTQTLCLVLICADFFICLLYCKNGCCILCNSHFLIYYSSAPVSSVLTTSSPISMENHLGNA